MPSELPIPWLLHGDAAPFTEVDSIQVLSFRPWFPNWIQETTAPPHSVFSIQWFCFNIGLASPCRCLLSKRSVSESQLLITAIPKLAMTKKSFKQVMETAAWSWQILFSGVIPKKDQFGNPVEEFRGRRMRRGVLWSITGDLEWFCQEFCQEFNFPWPASNMMCPYCRADQMKEDSKNSFTDFRPCATWRDTIHANSQLKTKFLSPPIFKAPSVSILSVKLDRLHTVDLGVAAYLHWVFAIQHHGGAAWQKQILRELACVSCLCMGWTALGPPSFNWAGHMWRCHDNKFPAEEKQGSHSSTRRSLRTMTSSTLRPRRGSDLWAWVIYVTQWTICLKHQKVARIAESLAKEHSVAGKKASSTGWPWPAN